MQLEFAAVCVYRIGKLEKQRFSPILAQKPVAGERAQEVRIALRSVRPTPGIMVVYRSFKVV